MSENDTGYRTVPVIVLTVRLKENPGEWMLGANRIDLSRSTWAICY